VIEYTLPFPPTVNTYYRTPSYGKLAGRTMKSAKARAYLEQCGRAVMLQGGAKRATGRVSVQILASPPDRRTRDLDNLLKGVADSLTKCGLIDDDSKIDDLRITRGEVVKGGSVRVRIQQMKPTAF
jgi:crossover junction endodeoxyribonuclease RusA